MKRSKRHTNLCFVNRRFWSQRIGGFTLIELLTVITVITLLLGLSFPCIHIGVNSAYQMQCQSNLKQLYILLQTYAEQHGGQFPNVTDLSQVPQQVMKALGIDVNSMEIIRCPKDPEKRTHPGGSYEFRVTHDPETSLAGVRLDLIPHPGKVIIAGERSPGWHKSGMINVLYLDGHVEQVTEEEWWINITTPWELL